MTCSHIIYVLLLLVNMITAIYIGKITWLQRKSDTETRLMGLMFLALSVLGITQIFHLMESEKIWFTFTLFRDIVHLLCK
jgi:hypothetical protein